jgi:ABC-2 type transport system ATP-binding protein
MATGKASDGGVVLSRLSKSYGGLRAVDSIDLKIPRGDTVAILGPNGAGKSTTLDMLLGLTRPDSGSIALFGLPPARAIAAGRVGGMLQTGSPIDHLSVREFLTMIASLYPRPLRVDHVLRLTGAAGFADRRTNNLSGGQMQRVRFAAAMIANSDLLVLDEPTAAIDVEGRREFWTAIREVAAEGKTIIFATHYLEEADAYADRIVLLARGKIVADGPATEIKAKAERRGEAVTLNCVSSDDALRALLGRYPQAHDIEVQGAGIEDAFFALTASGSDIPNQPIKVQGIR